MQRRFLPGKIPTVSTVTSILKLNLPNSLCVFFMFFFPAFQCDKGWFGTDCSIPSTLSTVGEWPQWLRPAHLEVPSDKNVPGNLINLSAVVKKKRPLIYIYDLPPDFNSLLLEVTIQTFISLLKKVRSLFMIKFLISFGWNLMLQGRHFKLECVNRIYDDRNATIWTDYLYGSQVCP